MNILYNIKLVYRNFINQRPYSFFNLIGLSVGLSVAFIALLCVTEHTGYDTHHKNSKNIYRLLSKRAIDGNQFIPQKQIGPLKTIKNQVPEIVNWVGYAPSRFDVEQESELNESGTSFNMYPYSHEIYANPEIVDVLTFNIVDGDFKSFKTDPKTIIISERYALKHFNSVFVAGKSISFKKQGTFTVGAVFKDFPKKSSVNPELIVPIKNLKPRHSRVTTEERWVYNYFLLEKNANLNTVIKKIDQVVKPLLENNETVKHKFQALENVHLYSENITNSFSVMTIKKLAFYIIIGVLVLLISLVNFLLMYSAMAKRRLKEFMIRKANGLGILGLIKIFLIESIIVSFSASILALVITSFLIPIFNEITHNNLELSLNENYAFLGYIIVLVILISLLSSSYLYLLIKKYNTIAIFDKENIIENNIFNNGIVMLQLVIISVMVVFSMGYYKQLHFMIHADKGYKAEDIIVLNSKFNTPTLKEKLLRNPLILSMANGYSLPSRTGMGFTISRSYDDQEKFAASINYIDNNYLPMYKIQLKEGKNFTENPIHYEIIVNETTVRKLGLENPIGEKISVGVIRGVVKDYYISSFKKAIGPVVLINAPSSSTELSIKYVKGRKEEAIQAIKKIIDKEFPENIVDLTAHDTYLDMQYYRDKTMLKVVLTLTLSAIFITILGLIGMSLFKTQQKTKEIGIRKVNGATINEIMFMLNKDFVKWVLIAFVIACPIAYYAMSKWLENFAYKTTLSWWVFALAGVFTLIIALLTVSWQTYRAATRNPVESLRDE